MHAGSSNAEKIVLAVSKHDTARCIAAIVEEIKQLRSRAGDKDIWGGINCNVPIQHQNIYLSTRWLDKGTSVIPLHEYSRVIYCTSGLKLCIRSSILGFPLPSPSTLVAMVGTVSLGCSSNVPAEEERILEFFVILM